MYFTQSLSEVLKMHARTYTNTQTANKKPTIHLIITNTMEISSKSFLILWQIFLKICTTYHFTFLIHILKLYAIFNKKNNNLPLSPLLL